MRARNRIILALLVAMCGCKKTDPGPELQIVGESGRLRSSEPTPRTSPWFDGTKLSLIAARGETLGIQVLHRGGGTVSLTIAGTTVTGFDVKAVAVKRPSSDMYGGSQGTGDYSDELVPAASPTTDPAYFQIAAGGETGTFKGELAALGKHIPVELVVVPVTLGTDPWPFGVWAEFDPRELGSTAAAPTAAERACIAMFRDRGVLLAPPTNAAAYAARVDLLKGSLYAPADLPTDPAAAAAEVKAWIAATRPYGQEPFAIPIDEPNAASRDKVHALAQTVRDAGGGPGHFLFAVTDVPRPEYTDVVDLYIPLAPHADDSYPHWTYNGAPPRAGSMVVDTAPPGLRTWGWIAWRYHIPIWYAWNALYWHDRHNHKHETPRALDAHADATSFDDGDDHGNLDGVLALPGDAAMPCHPTLRLEALRRGLEDRALLELAAKCNASETAKLAEQLVPRALGDASGAAAWPSDEASWETARQRLLVLADCN